MSIQRFVAFDQYEGSMETAEMSNSFIVDIENLSPSTINNSPAANSKVKLQRNLSRKVSQRDDRNKSILLASSGITDESSSTGEKESKPQPTITLSAEKGFNSRKSIKQRNSFVDPRRVLFIFATLSSMGTIILIYFTLSISRFSGSADAQAQQ